MKHWKLALALALLLCALLSVSVEAEEERPKFAVKGFHFASYFDPGDITTPDGQIYTDTPFTEVRMWVFNERTMENDCKAGEALEEPVTEYDASNLLKKLRLYNLKSGEKTLIVEVYGDFGTLRVLEKPFYVRGSTREPVHMTDVCKVTNSRGEPASNAVSHTLFHGWVNKTGDDYIIVKIPAERPAEGMSMFWDKPPEDYRIEFYDAGGNEILLVDSTNPYGFYNIYEEIPPETVELHLFTSSTTNKLCRLRIYEQGKVSSVVQRWQPLPEDVDLMYIGAHKNDETVFFSGCIPLTIAQGRTVAVVLVTEYETRAGDEEFFEAIWALGVRYQPIIMRKWDGKKPMEQMEEIWGGYDNVCGEMVELMRRYKPEVVLTHDIDGENGHIQHILTSRLVIDAVQRTGDEQWYPESVAKYGAWTVPKLYLHLYDESRRLDLPFYEPQECFGGRSAMDMAYSSFDKYQSQIQASSHYSLDVLGRWHDKTFFGLYYSTVGEDVEKTSFFEHIDE